MDCCRRLLQAPKLKELSHHDERYEVITPQSALSSPSLTLTAELEQTGPDSCVR